MGIKKIFKMNFANFLLNVISVTADPKDCGTANDHDQCMGLNDSAFKVAAKCCAWEPNESDGICKLKDYDSEDTEGVPCGCRDVNDSECVDSDGNCEVGGEYCIEATGGSSSTKPTGDNATPQFRFLGLITALLTLF